MQTLQREKMILMSISQLREVPIKNREEEALVQEILDEKLKHEPQISPNRKVFAPEETDSMTPEKERKLQAILDGEIESTPTASEPVEIESEPTGTDTIAPEATVPVATATKSVFCQFCDSRGVRHKKECTRLNDTPHV